MGRTYLTAASALAAVLLTPLTATADSERKPFSNSSLNGSYGYSSLNEGVASFGVIQFDGAGDLKLKLMINAPSANGERSTVSATGTGTFQVEADGSGSATVDFKEIPIEKGVYDFVIVSSDHGVADEIYAVLRSGGLKGQLVNPTWTRISKGD